MSNALAIAHVTRALALLLESHVGPEFGEAVRVEPRKPPAEPPDQPTLNVFLYQVTPNTSMRHHDLPTRAPDGTLLRRPAAALDLHYLISAYGEETRLVGQRLIGAVVRTLHEIPVLPGDVVEQAGEEAYLAGSDLAEAAQRVRFSPTVMDVDETSKLWGMLHQTPYALSVVYQASLVLIDGRGTPVPAKPVERPSVRALPFGAPGAPVPPVPPMPSVPPVPPAPPGGAPGGGAGGNGSGGTLAGAAAGTPARGRTGAPAKAAVEPPVRPPAKASARTPSTGTPAAKAPAKAAAKAPARGRKGTRAAGRSPKPDGGAGGTARGANADTDSGTDNATGSGSGGTEN
ncbi:DUF4255 domain-containing protein [Streptomyces chilikensis]|uniref:DUF4255 domain-containing protein n=1 Tax=Streptomyces chilikensis TaxID=1194079 RepID=A0ABV3EPM0_9ACTN